MENKSRKYDILLEILWLSAIFLIPLVFWPYLNVTFELPKAVVFKILVLIMLAVYMFKIASERSIKIPLLKERAGKWLIYLVLAYFAIYILATVFSVSPLLSFYGSYYRMQGTLQFMHYFSFALIIFLNLKTIDQAGRLLKVFLAAVGVVSLLGILQKFFPELTQFWQINVFRGRIFGTMGHPNYLADLIVMALPFGVGFLFLKGGLKAINWRKFGLLLLIAIMLLALFWTLGRASLFGFVVSILFLLISVFWIKGRRLAALSLLMIPALIAVGVLFINVYKTSPIIKNTSVLSRFVFVGENLRSIETRLIMWPSTVKQILDRPVFGYGPETFANTFQKYADKKLLELENFSDIADRAHNVILDTAVSIGIVGAFAYLVMLVFVFINGFRDFGGGGKIDEKSILKICIMSSVLGLFVSNQFGFSTTGHYAAFWLMIAVFCFLMSDGFVKKDLSFFEFGFARLVFIAIAAIFAAIMIFSFGARPVIADYFYRNAIDSASDPQKSIEYFDKALAWNRRQNYYNFTYSNYLINFPQFLEDAKNVIHAGARISAGKDGMIYFTLGKIEARLGNAEKAYENFEAASKLMPIYPFIYIEWGDAHYNAGDFKKAAEKYEYYLLISPPCYKWRDNLEQMSKEQQGKYEVFYKLNPDFNDVFVKLGRAYFQAGDKQKALEYLNYADENLEKISTLSVIYGETGEKKKAIEITKKGGPRR